MADVQEVGSRQIPAGNGCNEEFWQAVQDENVSKVISLLHMADVSWRNEEHQGKTPLHLAVMKQNSTLVALLLGKGADVSIRDDDGKSSLITALETNNKEICNLLAEKITSSVEEMRLGSKHKTTHSEKKAYKRMKEMYSKLSRPPDNKDNIDAEIINANFDKIFEPVKQTSIFQDHVPRKSAITIMLAISHFQTIYNIFVAIFVISLMNTLLANYYESGSPLSFDLLFWAFKGFETSFIFWTLLVLFSHSVYFLQRAIITNWLSPRAAYTLYTLMLIGMHVVVVYVVRFWFCYPPATSAFVVCEAVRLSMKMHSYLMVNRALRIAKEHKEEDPSVKEYPTNVTLFNYFEYLWLPTLVYQTSYPRTTTRRWGFVFKRFGEVALCILYIYAVWVRYCASTVKELEAPPGVPLALAIFKMMVPGIAASLLGFFMVLHSWQNAFAEMTMFADRHFYSDWWNATDWATYYRKWNYVVHHFIHRHVFIESMIRFSSMSRTVAMGLTFFLSALIHEYVLIVALGFFKPVMFLMFFFPGVFFIPLTRLFKGSRGWNIFMWAMLIVGHGMLVGFYARAWTIFHSGISQPWIYYVWIF